MKPSINFVAWEAAKKNGIIDADFFLADLLSEEDKTITDNLNILLKSDRYRQAAGRNNLGQTLFTEIGFTDGQRAYRDFWRLYCRPPQEEYWDYIVNRRDLLVPQDIREVKGAFFTPSCWVELSQEYLARALGENWQDEYVVWDCCAGTGNLLAGLTNKKNLWASTLDQTDVDVMLQRIQNMNKGLADGESGANLYPSHVFQFRLPQRLLRYTASRFARYCQRPRKTQKTPPLYQPALCGINPPYAEAATSRTKTRTGENKPGVADHALNKQYRPLIGAAVNELFALFLMRIHEEIPGCSVGQFSTLKHLQAPNFKDFREHFHARLCRSFIVPADTFDNVSGKFPIGFFVWRLSEGNEFNSDEVDVYDRKGNSIGAKTICAISRANVINRWLHGFLVTNGTPIGWLRFVPNDFQNNSGVYLTLKPKDSDVQESRVAPITKENCTVIAMYLAIRNSVESTWLNNRDQFLYPKDTWKEDTEFQRNCLVYTLFHGQNRIRSADGPNHWVPFAEEEIGTKDEIKSHFMIDLLAGKGGKRHVQGDLFETGEGASRKPVLSSEARAVLEAAKGLYRYYHSLPDANPDASFYDIRLRFQKTDDRGRMNPSSDDETYNALLASLRSAQKALAARIAQGVCRHGFLK